MIFVMGGAYQGKTTFVKNNLIQSKSYRFYDLHTFELDAVTEDVIVFKAIEKSIRKEKDIQKYKTIVEQLVQFEKDNQIQVIFIGDVIGSGVVPTNKEDRIWRDNVGFFYQYLTSRCKEVYRLWAGLPEKLKG